MKASRPALAIILVAFSSLTLSAPPQRLAAKIEALKALGKKKGWTFSVGYNEALEHTLRELTGYKKDPAATRKAIYGTPTALRVPSKWDWREQVNGGLTPIKSQGECGSCWAFGTVAVFENLLKIRDGVTRILSEQQLVSCNHEGWNCRTGGSFAHQYHQSPGAALDADFPYVARDVRCRRHLKTDDKIESWAYVGHSDQVRASVDDLKQAIYQYGPIAVTVYATESMLAYTGGIYNDCVDGDTNHLVALVGWNDEGDSGGYWIMRNSWGTSWGEQGYMRIKYGCNSVAEDATYVTYKSHCTPQPVAFTEDKVTIKAGRRARLGGMAIIGQTYDWTPTTALDDPHSPAPLASPTQTTTYTLSAHNNCGTATKDEVVEVIQ